MVISVPQELEPEFVQLTTPTFMEFPDAVTMVDRFVELASRGGVSYNVQVHYLYKPTLWVSSPVYFLLTTATMAR
jgi:hypothetical protein